ncbi:MAG: ABC transporter permease [Acidimicrobiales bacterium]|jgi:ABC-2 type transport system permease protein/oleandomycin transport system permease protein
MTAALTTVSNPAARRTGAPGVPTGVARLRWVVADTLTVTKRNLIAYTRTPEALFFSTLQPIMFVLLFRYVFGGAIPISGHLSYIDYLMAGIFVQSVAFGGIGAAVGLAEDLQKGLIERFRALPMARSAVLAGRTTADLARNVFVVLLMTGVGAAVGFDFPNGALNFIYAAALALLFSYALLWGFALVGLLASNSETAQVIAFPILFPLIFASPAFVQTRTMPSWLRTFANDQPIGVLVNAIRSLMVGPRPQLGLQDTGGHVLAALLWCAGFLVVLAPLAVWRYRRST